MSRWGNKYVIGLTGNIATGKSVVRQMLQHLGAYTIDADGLSHQAMQPGAPAYKPIVEKFGMFILDENKRINREVLGNLVFSNPTALKQLESIVHPIVNQAINTLVTRAKQRVVVIEAIKLLEGNLAEAVDAVWVVDASPNTQLERLTKKRKMDQNDASKRMNAQNPQAEKLAKADVVIKNDGSVEDTWKQVQVAWEDVKKAVIAQTQSAKTVETEKPAQKPAQAAPATSEVAGGRARADQVDVEPPPPAEGIEVKRGMPGNAEIIAQFISGHSDRDISRMDVMMSFGQKSYLIAESSQKVVAVLGWQVENLITRADEFYIDSGAPSTSVVQSLVNSVETASQELQSEVGFIFLQSNASDDVVQSFGKYGYQVTGISDIKIPAWREAVQETLSNDGDMKVLFKKLREDRVLKPI